MGIALIKYLGNPPAYDKRTDNYPVFGDQIITLPCSAAGDGWRIRLSRRHRN